VSDDTWRAVQACRLGHLPYLEWLRSRLGWDNDEPFAFRGFSEEASG
jgi:hypothetical protein